MLSTPPAFVLSQDQTLVFNPSCYSGFFVPVSFPPPEPHSLKQKLISELTVVFPQSLCIVFKILAPPARFPSLEHLVRIPHCYRKVNTFFHPFSLFFISFFYSRTMKNPFNIKSRKLPNIIQDQPQQLFGFKKNKFSCFHSFPAWNCGNMGISNVGD